MYECNSYYSQNYVFVLRKSIVEHFLEKRKSLALILSLSIPSGLLVTASLVTSLNILTRRNPIVKDMLPLLILKFAWKSRK